MALLLHLLAALAAVTVGLAAVLYALVLGLCVRGAVRMRRPHR